MARRSPEPLTADLPPEKIPGFIRKIERRISDLKRFDPESVDDRFDDPNLSALVADIEGTLSAVFGHRTAEYLRYYDATDLDTAPMAQRVPLGEVRDGLKMGRDKAIGLLESARRFLEERLDDAELESPPSPAGQASEMTGNKVFVVHGHDLDAAQTVARFVEQLGLEPIILHEQPNRGRALIDKFEQHSSDVVFAVVIITPDDLGAAKSELDAGSDDKKKLTRLNPRARQNVILELGYFYGKLGRRNVVALRKGKVEEPSDNVGVTFTTLDSAGAWKNELAREMADAGVEVDANALLGRASGLKSGGATHHLKKDDEALADSDFISLNEAAVQAYEETEESIVARFAEMPLPGGGSAVLSWYARAIIGKGLDVSLFGRKLPSRVHRKIPLEDIPKYGFSDDASSLIRYGKKEPEFIELRIRRADFEQRLNEIKSWGGDNSLE